MNLAQSQGPVSSLWPIAVASIPKRQTTLEGDVQVWGEHSQPHILQVRPFSPNNQAAAARSASVHNPEHYNRMAEDLKTVVECLRDIRSQLYQQINYGLKDALDGATPSLLADIERGAAPKSLVRPCVRAYYVSPQRPPCCASLSPEHRTTKIITPLVVDGVCASCRTCIVRTGQRCQTRPWVSTGGCRWLVVLSSRVFDGTDVIAGQVAAQAEEERQATAPA